MNKIPFSAGAGTALLAVCVVLCLNSASASTRAIRTGLQTSQGASPGADYPAPVEGDFLIHDFRFEDGENLPELRLHYRTIGALKRDVSGRASNAVIILHGTGGAGTQFLSKQFAGV
ncbi:MAG TPA: hypothetical protein VJX67_25165, partial [Blastocatellia bacterium]|nr:hypothetical protein [Blastocatellia bacterium]